MGPQRDDLFVGGILVVAVASVATVLLAIPYVMPARVIIDEPSAVAGMRAYISAQNQFKRTDFYGIGKKVYASSADGNGFADLYQLGYPACSRSASSAGSRCSRPGSSRASRITPRRVPHARASG